MMLPIERPTLARFCAEHRIRRLSLFGLQQRGTAGPQSDVDLLVWSSNPAASLA
jgi:predicted nucleotidyltransferase